MTYFPQSAKISSCKISGHTVYIVLLRVYIHTYVHRFIVYNATYIVYGSAISSYLCVSPVVAAAHVIDACLLALHVYIE